MHKIWLLLLPELRGFPPGGRCRALRCAWDTPLEPIELLGLAIAVVAVAALTQYGLADPAPASRLAAALLNLAVAVPLIAAAAAPIHLRRLRRGLRSQLHPHHE
ncbi:hypothetical protein [Ramlibacter sp.]|uniref:hypothetical protein n=1 Tax=Ramlibacter sp. TaxID=1917967 RepID=UPI002CBB6A84|nr:hypothetical protein [Ramlibacter sp.]HWI83810.1 hypothetical protein [Ramlibacter sp.]